MFERISADGPSSFHSTGIDQLSCSCVPNSLDHAHFLSDVGHFGHGHFGLGRFGPDISASDVSATENAKGGRFGDNHKLWVGVCACINW